MKLADKRKVIEVLLCCAQNPDSIHEDSTWDTCTALDFDDATPVRSDAAWQSARDDVAIDVHDGSHGTACLEAAYRLIEVSPTLRREWFSRSK